MADFKEEKTQRKLDLLRKKEEEESMMMLAQRFGVPYADVSSFPVEIDAIKTLPENEARAGEMVVLQITGKHLKVGVHNPEREETKTALKKLQTEGYTTELFIVSKNGLEHAWNFYKKVPQAHTFTAGTILISDERIQALENELNDLNSIKNRIEQTFASRTTESLEVILAGAVAIEASDVHIEPQKGKIRLRFRLDGVLHDVSMLPPNLYALLLSRIKLVSELKLNIHDKAQDGRFSIRTHLGDVEVRTSVLPGPEGENIVLRILNPKAINISFEDLGLNPLLSRTLAQELEKPNGMILTTGPTGSGKTTALYTFLKKIHTPEIKIITLEDPIEYHIEGVEQTQVDTEKGYDFANGLRAIVRQDPDVILVGEIRDLETADTAINAALTGHLVFSTLHTNNAAGAIPRLINLGVKASSIAPALNIAMAQRLVRKLCSSCRVKINLAEEAELQKKISSGLSEFPKNFPIPSPGEWEIYMANKKGCPECNNTSYKGRTGVFEIILINDAVEKLILQDPTEYDLKNEAKNQEQIDMRQDGILKVLKGVTDFGEIERVVGS